MNISPKETKDDAKDGEAEMHSHWFKSMSTLEDLNTLDLFGGEVDNVYQTKVRILNHAIQEIGMGKYQVRFDSLRTFCRTQADGVITRLPNG